MDCMELIVQPLEVLNEKPNIGRKLNNKLLISADLASYPQKDSCFVSKLKTNTVKLFAHGDVASFILKEMDEHTSIFAKGCFYPVTNEDNVFIIDKVQLFNKKKSKEVKDKSGLLKSLLR